MRIAEVRRGASPAGLFFLLAWSLASAACNRAPQVVSPATIDGLRMAIGDRDEEVRRQAYEDLVELVAIAPRLPSLLGKETKSLIADDFLDEDAEMGVVVAALSAYRELDYAAPHPRSIELARHELPEIRAAALRALSAQPDEDAKGVILEGLVSKEYVDVRLAALEAASALGAQQSIAAADLQTVLALLEDDAVSVRRGVVESLEALTPGVGGRELGDALLARLGQQSDLELCEWLLIALRRIDHMPEIDMATLATRCAGLGTGSGRDREVWSQAAEAAAQFSDPSAEVIFERLDQPERFDPAVVLRILRTSVDAEKVADLFEKKPDLGARLKDLLARDHTEDTRIEALKTVCRFELGCSEAALRLLPGAVDKPNAQEDPDPLDTVVRAALDALENHEISPSLYLQGLINFMARKTTWDDAPLRDALARTYWLDPDAAREHLPEVDTRLLKSPSLVLKTRAVNILGAHSATITERAAELWRLLEEHSPERSDPEDRPYVLRAAVIRAIGNSSRPTPYLAEIARYLHPKRLSDDPSGIVRIAAIETLSSSSAWFLYSTDLIRSLQSDQLNPGVKRKLVAALKRWTPPDPDHETSLEPDQLAIILNYLYTGDNTRVKEHRYHSLYFGAPSRDNRMLLSVVGLLERDDDVGDREVFRLMTELVPSGDLHEHFRNKLAADLAIRSAGIDWQCRDQSLLEQAAHRLQRLRYGQESRVLTKVADRFDAAYCAEEAMKRNFTTVLAALSMLVLLGLLLRGFL